MPMEWHHAQQSGRVCQQAQQRSRQSGPDGRNIGPRTSPCADPYRPKSDPAALVQRPHHSVRHTSACAFLYQTARENMERQRYRAPVTSSTRATPDYSPNACRTCRRSSNSAKQIVFSGRYENLQADIIDEATAEIQVSQRYASMRAILIAACVESRKAYGYGSSSAAASTPRW